MKTTATIDQLKTALEFTNDKFAGNIRFKEIKQVSRNRVQFTLTVVDSRKPGAKRNPQNGRRISAACWHAHGYFFDALWAIDPEIIILTGQVKMTGPADNWQDFPVNRGFMASQCCEC